MKFSSQYESGGLTGYIRSVQTGEYMHFTFNKPRTSLPIEVSIGGRRLEAFLRIVKVETDEGDDIDLELVLRAPDVATTDALDFVPKVAPPVNGGRIDVDGAAMSPLSADAAVSEPVAESAPTEVKDPVLAQPEVTALPEVSSDPLPLNEVNVEPGAEEDMIGDAPSKDDHPATQIPELPGVGADRRRFNKRR